MHTAPESMRLESLKVLLTCCFLVSGRDSGRSLSHIVRRISRRQVQVVPGAGLGCPGSLRLIGYKWAQSLNNPTTLVRKEVGTTTVAACTTVN